ncbi:MAG: hypothetical protein LAT65_14425 [Saccharospirillum sp.]|nr:hypothetical protein [Saccharospirillum sp.]
MEIAERDKTSQTRLLQQARYVAFVTLGLAGKAAFLGIICLLLSFAVAIGPHILLETGQVGRSFFQALGMLVFIFTFQHFYRGLLAKGLALVLSQERKNSDE